MRYHLVLGAFAAAIASSAASAGSIAWECRISIGKNDKGEDAILDPATYEEVDGYLITPPGDFSPRLTYTITQESDSALIAERRSTAGAHMDLAVILLNKKTGHIKLVDLDATPVWIEVGPEGTCVRK